MTCTWATSAKYPRWLKWKATPMAVSLGSLVLPQPERSATDCSTPVMRAASKATGANATGVPGGGGADGRGVAASMSSRNCNGSFPAACASSSMNDCMTNAIALLPGARMAPIGTPLGIIELSCEKFGTKRDGNSSPERPALCAKRPFSPKVTKWLRQATSLPLRIDARPSSSGSPAGR